MKNKGFTLVELLAVIVILAIIALIATPIVLNVIEDSRINSNRVSAQHIIDGVEQAYNIAYAKSYTAGTNNEITVTAKNSGEKPTVAHVASEINFKNANKPVVTEDGFTITSGDFTCTFTVSSNNLTIEANGCGTDIALPKTAVEIGEVK